MVNPRTSVPTNLPAPLTSFVGREREMAEVRRLLSGTRLLTLTGAGGSGKSRLAFEAARASLADFPDGVWLVELAALSDGRLVPHAAAAALSVHERSKRSVTDTLAAALRDRTLLLVLDNCEHLLNACAVLAGTLLRECPGVRILATSREALGVPGETIWRVPSLDSPDPFHVAAPDRLTGFEAVRLFADRAASVRPGFLVTAGNARAVAQICRRLDGIPLAIELAAARVRALSVEQIAARLDDRFGLLTGGNRTALPRHRTLRAAMDWSYDLLTDRERTLLARLSVFAGGWTLEAAEAICADNGIGRVDIVDLMTSLIDKSLVLADIHDGAARYGMLETVRQYAAEHVERREPADHLRRRHRDWYLALAEQGSAELDGPQQKAWLDRMDREYGNLRGALDWSRGTAAEVEPGLRLAVHLQRFWEMRAYYAEARAWLESMIAAGRTADPGLRARALNTAGVLAYRQGDYQRTAALCLSALSLAEQYDDAYAAAQALHSLAHVQQSNGEYDQATDMMARSVQLYEQVNYRRGQANSVDCLGEIARSKGDYERAEMLTQRAMKLYEEVGEARGRSHLLHNLAYIRLHQGRTVEARDLFRESLVYARDLKSPRDVIMAIAGLAAASKDALPERVARVLGAVGGLLEASGVHLEPAEHTEFEETTAFVRGQLGEHAFTGARDGGRTMTSDEAAAEALDLCGTAAGRGGAAGHPGTASTPLTAREREVAALIAHGLSNRQIASRLVIAERTAEGHVQSILNKLGFGSRAQIAAWAVEHGLRAPSA
jgi:predicted ATPase/DNA-binding CsgD family transcriptional regulator